MQPLSTQNFLDWILKQRILLHVLFWTVVLIYFILGYQQNRQFKLEFYRSLAFLPNHMWLAYSFMYFLIPRFLLKNKILLFFGFALLLIGLNMYFSYLINFKFLASISIQKKTWWTLGGSLLGCLTILGIAVSIKLLRYWAKEKRQNVLIQQEKMTAELQMLKSQVHPHFLFNTLNNIYSLTLEKSNLAPIIILKLSDLLRYMLYECDATTISLSKELEMMNYYVDLEQLRYGDRLDVSKSYSGEIEGKMIPPLLFLPLLENCFKHGTSNQIDQSWISIHLHVENNILSLKLINSKMIDKNFQIVSGGIGLYNVEKRLQLLYGERYSLKILPDEETFTLSLTMPISEHIGESIMELRNVKSGKYEHQMPVGG